MPAFQRPTLALFSWRLTLTFDLLIPKLMDFQDLSWNICMSTLSFLAASFLANVLRYVRYMLSAVRLSSVVCRLSVTLVHPTQAVELFRIFFTIR